MVVVCLWNEGREKELEVGKQYNVTPISKHMVELENDKGNVIRSVKTRFKVLKDK